MAGGGTVMARKVVWATILIECQVDDGVTDESLMDWVNEELVDAGYIVDDMGMAEGSDEEQEQ
jgi:hypothetical protein